MLLLAPVALFAETITGTVVAIADGDTVTVLDETKRQHKVRLAGIDAPERKQAFGTRSRQSLADLVFQQQVRADCPKIDRYGRRICTLYVDEQDVNLVQIARGMAWWYRQYQHEQSMADRSAYEAAEKRAHRSKTGLWTDASPTAPWDFRANKRRR